MTSTPPNLDRALDVWARRKWLAAIVFVAVAGAAVTIAKSLPNLYRATATVIVERDQVSDAFVRTAVTAELETRLQTIREAVMSRTRLTQLIRQLDLYPDLRSHLPVEVLVDRLRREIELEVKGVESQMSGRTSTIAFTISFGGRDPQTVARVANEVAGLYVEANTSIREGQAARTAGFLKAQLDEIRGELDRQDQRANAFKLTHMGELPQQVDANLAGLERLNTQLRLNGENQIRLMDRRDRLERQRAENVTAPAAPAPSPDEQRLATLRQQLEDLRRRFTDAYPDVVRLRTQVDTLAAQVARHPRPAASSTGARDAAAQSAAALADVTGELEALKDEERSLRQTIASYEARVENAPKRQQEFQEISRDYANTKERYDSLLKRYEEAQLAESLEQGRNAEQFRILDPALPPLEPVAPNRIRLLVLGLLLAAGLAVGAVLAAERIDSGFHDIEDLRAFVPVPTIGSVPMIQTRASRRRGRQRVLLTTMSAAALLALVFAGARYVAHGNEALVRIMERSRG